MKNRIFRSAGIVLTLGMLSFLGIPQANAGGKPDDKPKNEFNIMMNYELGMHCTGFEFSYCCVLPPYNSILAQVVKTEKDGVRPHLLEADPSVGLDGLGRPTVLRDPALDKKGNFKKYVLRYWHDAQPRNDGRGAPQSDTLISLVEGNSLLMWNTVLDSAGLGPNGELVEGPYDGAHHVVQGDGDYSDPTDNYANAWLNHLYIYLNDEGNPNLEGENATGDSVEADKIRLGVDGHVVYPVNVGAALQPMGPGVVGAGFSNVLTSSGETGTVVYTQMNVLENLPVMLTSPRLWEALGLPLTPFEDSIDFFGDPGGIDEDSVRPYVLMKAQLHEYDPGEAGGIGKAIMDKGHPVIGFGTAPIDIPNCERCHALGNGVSVNSANNGRQDVANDVQAEIEFWNAYYDIDVGAGDSDWYSRLKAAAISILAIHDDEHLTSFTGNFPAVTIDENGNLIGDTSDIPQNTRLGHEAVMCQKCHSDNVIAVVKSAHDHQRHLMEDPGHMGGHDHSAPGHHLFHPYLIPPLSEAIHNNHKDNPFSDSQDRNGGCQGCHPAHRSDGDLAGYPITELGLNAFAAGDNRDAAGGCFVGRDVHSNRNRNNDGVETPSYLNPVGQWLVDNVASDTGEDKGIWCTNCHTQLSQQLWKAENVADLINAQPGDPGHVREPFVGAGLADVVTAINSALGTTTTVQQAVDWLDPKNNDDTATIWEHDPGICDYVASLFGGAVNPLQDANVATIEVNLQSEPIVTADCTTGYGVPGPDCDDDGNPDFAICGSLDADNDFSVSLLAGGLDSEDGSGTPCDPNTAPPGTCFAQSPFCTTPDCVAAAQATLTGAGQAAVPVPFSAATDGRDHWLAGGEPHCADCHAAPYVEQSGNRNFFPPFNYPRKASLNRYSRGHQDITCQGCHESIHGLYPVTPDIDTTTYAQAASMNSDGSHGPLKCGACHTVNDEGVPSFIRDLEYQGQPIRMDFDRAVSWAHTFTAEADPTEDLCVNCHQDESGNVASTHQVWLEHAQKGQASRHTMDKVEIEVLGHVAGDPDFEDPLTTVCQGCHVDKSAQVACNESWKTHLPDGMVSEAVWEQVSKDLLGGSTCGW